MYFKQLLPQVWRISPSSDYVNRSRIVKQVPKMVLEQVLRLADGFRYSRRTCQP
jgi:hypothetical protein